jgi:hypothetical protein
MIFTGINGAGMLKIQGDERLAELAFWGRPVVDSP